MCLSTLLYFKSVLNIYRICYIPSNLSQFQVLQYNALGGTGVLQMHCLPPLSHLRVHPIVMLWVRKQEVRR